MMDSDVSNLQLLSTFFCYLTHTFANKSPEPLKNVKSVLVAIAAERLIVLLTWSNRETKPHKMQTTK